MPTLRNSIINQIVENLNYGDYQIEDFDCKFPDGTTTLASITFKAYPEYTFQITEDYVGNNITKAMAAVQGGGKKVLRTIEKPGEYKTFEQSRHDDIYSCISRVSNWVVNIRDDLVDLQHKYDSVIDEVTDNFQKHIDESIEKPDEYFDDDEKLEIIDKLSKLQQRVNDLEERFDIPEEKSKDITKAIEKSKKDIEVYPKGVWYKTAGNKIITSLKQALKTKEGRDILLEITKKLLS